MNTESALPPTSREISARTCLIVSAVLIVLGMVIISPVGAVAMFALSALFTLAGLGLGHKRYGKAGLALLIIAILLTAWSFPEARNDYGRYLEKVR